MIGRQIFCNTTGTYLLHICIYLIHFWYTGVYLFHCIVKCVFLFFWIWPWERGWGDTPYMVFIGPIFQINIETCLKSKISKKRNLSVCIVHAFGRTLNMTTSTCKVIIFRTLFGSKEYAQQIMLCLVVVLRAFACKMTVSAILLLITLRLKWCLCSEPSCWFGYRSRYPLRNIPACQRLLLLVNRVQFEMAFKIYMHSVSLV